MKRNGKIKVMFAAPVPPPYGGIGNWVLLMDRCLKSDTDVDFLKVLDTSPKQRGLDGRSLWNRVVGQGFEMLKLNKTLKIRMQAEKPDVIHITTSGQLAIIRDILFLKTAKKFHIPTVYHIRFGRIPEIVVANTMEWKLMRKAVSLASKTMAIDDKTYLTLQKHFGVEIICKMPNPFDISTVKTMQTKGNETEGHKVMFLGWCVKTKGIEELLTAWEEVCKEYPDWILEVVGPAEESYKASLIERFSMKQVAMLGEKNHGEALQLLNDADIFILPSYTEGFPNAVLEAMALKKPIIASDVGAIGEMLANNCGIVIQPQNVEDIVEALNKLIPDCALQRKLGENARWHLEEEYSIDAVIERYKTVWEEVSKKATSKKEVAV